MLVVQLIPGSYDVVVSSKLISKFTCREHDLSYYIALEPDSSYEERFSMGREVSS